MNGYSQPVALRVALILSLVFLAALFAYYPGLHGPFVFDDTINIVSNPRLALTRLDGESLLNAALSSDSGILKRPLAMATFAFNYYLAGGLSDTWPFKLTNLIIHLINTGLVYWLVSLLLVARQKIHGPVPEYRHGWIPGLVAAIWALHPMHLTSILYVVQRMTSLSALFVLTGLIVYLYGRLRVDTSRPRAYALMTTGLVIGLVLGLACKENAALLPFFALVIEFVFFERRRLDPAKRKKLAWFYGLSILVPIVAGIAWLALHPDFLATTYAAREFTPWQRLLTETRILWFYIGLLFIPDIGKFGLFHDDIAISTGLLTPWTTLPALFGLVAVLGLALSGRARSHYPMFSFAVLWFLAGHSMESGAIGLELAHEHRNYLPSLGPLLGGVCGLTAVLNQRIRWQAATIAVLAIALAFAAVTHLRSQTWRSETELIQSMVAHHPRSARSHGMLAELYAKRYGDIAKSLSHYQVAAALAPGEPSYLIRMALVEAQTPPEKPASSLIRDSLGTEQMESIGRQLAQRPLTPSTMADLRTMAICIPSHSQSCAGLYSHATSWYRAVIANRHVNDALRNDVIIYLFNIGIWHKDYVTALEAARMGRQHYPADMNFALMEANTHILSGRLDEARTIISSVEHSTTNRQGDLTEKIGVLRSMLQERQNKTAK
jgi:protein O-mannosyl-transferase